MSLIFSIKGVLSMPIFEYICRVCGHSFEKLVRTRQAEATIKCHSCQSPHVIKKISSFAINKTSGTEHPDCSSGCSGFERGSCGSGLCGGGLCGHE